MEMSDAIIDNTIIEKNGEIILSKNILLDDECDDLVEFYKTGVKNEIDTLGCRLFVTVIIPDETIKKIYALLSNYVLIKKIEPSAKIYYTVGGSIKEHIDVPLYDRETDTYSKYTLIIYLSNTEDDGGMTRIKRKKTYSFECSNDEMKHERHWIRPIKGNCLLFNSALYHDATESYGDKYILVTKVY